MAVRKQALSHIISGTANWYNSSGGKFSSMYQIIYASLLLTQQYPFWKKKSPNTRIHMYKVICNDKILDTA